MKPHMGYNQHNTYLACWQLKTHLWVGQGIYLFIAAFYVSIKKIACQTCFFSSQIKLLK